MILIPKYKDALQVSGSLSLVLVDKTNDKIKQEIYVPNLVVTSGKTWIATRMFGVANPVMGFMGLGTNGTAGDLPADTQLGTELAGNGYARAACSPVGGSASGTSGVQYISTFAAGNPSIVTVGAVLREAAIFTASTTGIMLCKTTFPTVTKMSTDALTITWVVTIN